MKHRYGFVSNSSSNSFILISNEEAVRKAKKKLTPYAKAVIEAIDFETSKFNNKVVLIYETCTSFFEELNNIENEEKLLKNFDLYKKENDWENHYFREEAFKEFANVIPEDKKIVFQTK
ncbi:MAG: hypothetical protein ACOCWG_02080 [bacterium]